MAQLLDRAPKLEKCSIAFQLAERRVRVYLKVDETETGGEPGVIKVIAKRKQDDKRKEDEEANVNEGESLVLEMSTKRTTKVEIRQ